MKSKKEFYEMYFKALAQQGFNVKRSTSSDYIADIYKDGQLIAFYTKSDAIEKNPFISTSTEKNTISTIQELAQKTALQCGICTENPYTEKNIKLPGGYYQLSSFNNVVLACKYHPLFQFVFSTYKISPENSRPLQTQHYYNKSEALEDFAMRSGLVNANKLFNETELIIIHSQLVKFQVSPNNNITVDEFQNIGKMIEKIEEIIPELVDKQYELDFEQEFDISYYFEESDIETEIGG